MPKEIDALTIGAETSVVIRYDFIEPDNITKPIYFNGLTVAFDDDFTYIQIDDTNDTIKEIQIQVPKEVMQSLATLVTQKLGKTEIKIINPNHN